MPYVKIPKDLSRVKTKLALNLTKRQLISFGIALVIGLPVFFVIKNAHSLELAGFVTFIVICPLIFVGLYERNGQPFERVLMNALKTFVIRAKQRPYKVINYYDAAEKQYDLENEIRQIMKGD
jgi:hypothetical protein